VDRNVGDSRPLLKAKLLVPHVASTTVNPVRLEGRLQAATHTRLTTVVAPAGWGKTTLLASRAGSPDWQVASVTMTAS
jgi:ATP/maltotriose-dependent transcriptional regulator MalT